MNDEVTPVSVTFVGHDMGDPLCVVNGISRRIETNSPAFARTLADIQTAATQQHPILLTGETGTGKKYLARLIHEISNRRYEPFLHVQCGTLSHESADIALFGRSANVSTGQAGAKEGAMTAVRRGTLVLDEVATLKVEPQQRLARLLSVNSTKIQNASLISRWPARLIVISDVDLQSLLQGGQIGMELFSALQSFRFNIPPLRERVDDIDLLAIKFGRQISIKFARPEPRIDPEVFDALRNYPWPGNVLELQHVVEKTILACRDDRVTVSHLPRHLTPTESTRTKIALDTASSAPHAVGADSVPENPPTEDVKPLSPKEIIEQTLFENTISRNQTAGHDVHSRFALYNKQKKYGFQG